MRPILASSLAALTLVLAAPAAAQQASPSPSGPMNAVAAFSAALDAGDGAKLAALCTPSVTVVDEFAPFVWRGGGACARWYSGFGALMKKLAMTKAHAMLGKPSANTVTGDRAYVVVPTRFTFLLKGKPEWEEGQWSFVLVRTSGAWAIDADTWATVRTSPGAAAAG